MGLGFILRHHAPYGGMEPKVRKLREKGKRFTQAPCSLCLCASVRGLIRRYTTPIDNNAMLLYKET